eukprot:scaffold89372_cov49-Prasinocladus_malaysianus.AAC.1
MLTISSPPLRDSLINFSIYELARGIVPGNIEGPGLKGFAPCQDMGGGWSPAFHTGGMHFWGGHVHI